MAEAGPVGGKGTHVSTACSPCRSAKAKCDGSQPCVTCVSKDRECYYEERQDARRGRKRALGELYSRSELLDSMVYALRDLDPRSVEDVVQVVNSSAPTAEIAQQAIEILGRTKAKQTRRTRQAVMNIVSLTDQPPIRVCARPWTDVTDDDMGVSHLLSVYFAWHYQTYPSVAPKLFIREMNSKKLSSDFCSPFLVNTLLTMGCMYTDHPIAFAEPGEPSTRGTHFLKEAIRLWDLEEGDATLTNLQGLTALVPCATSIGRDRIALLYTAQLILLRQELHRKVRTGTKQGLNEYTDRDFQHSYALATRASFSLEVEMSLAWRKPYNLYKPTTPRPFSEEELSLTEKWRPYPKAAPEIDIPLNRLTDDRYELYVIGADITAVLLSGNPDDSPLPGHIILEPLERLERTRAIEQRLLKWHNDLSPDAKIDITGSGPVAGPVLDSHLMYNGLRITIQGIILGVPSSSEDTLDAANDEILSACESIAKGIDRTQSSIGISYFSCYMAHGSSVGATSLISHLHQPGVPQVFHTIILALTMTCRRWTIAKGVVKALWITLQERKLDRYLSEATVGLLRLSAVETWGASDHRLFVKCTYPTLATANAKEMTGIGELLEKYARLKLDGTDGVDGVDGADGVDGEADGQVDRH